MTKRPNVKDLFLEIFKYSQGMQFLNGFILTRKWRGALVFLMQKKKTFQQLNFHASSSSAAAALLVIPAEGLSEGGGANEHFSSPTRSREEIFIF